MAPPILIILGEKGGIQGGLRKNLRRFVEIFEGAPSRGFCSFFSAADAHKMLRRKTFLPRSSLPVVHVRSDSALLNGETLCTMLPILSPTFSDVPSLR